MTKRHQLDVKTCAGSSYLWGGATSFVKDLRVPVLHAHYARRKHLLLEGGANWAYGVPIGNYGSPYVGLRVPGSPYHTGEVSLDDYGPGTLISVHTVNINVGGVLELAPGSELAMNYTTVDGSGHTVIASGLMINQGTMILDSGSAFEVKSLESGTGNFGIRLQRHQRRHLSYQALR